MPELKTQQPIEDQLTADHDHTLSQWPAFQWNHNQKASNFLTIMRHLVNFHRTHCAEYAKLLKFLATAEQNRFESSADIFYLPARIFKHQALSSIPQSDIIKTLQSSGTTGQNRSQIVLDRTTALMQSKVLVHIVRDFIGSKRLPMLIIDSPETLQNRYHFSARRAGIQGFSMFARTPVFALHNDMSLNWEEINRFCEQHPHTPIVLFGFTFMIWQHFVHQLKQANKTLDLSKGILIHGGGWKQLQQHAINHKTFNQQVTNLTGIQRIHNYYGMVEQAGSIFMACEHGHFHTSAWSDIIIRHPIHFSPLDCQQSGLVEVLSVIPRSYPGMAILTEDTGQLLGEDDCPCGRKGKYFSIHGRLAQAENRGCSDTYTR